MNRSTQLILVLIAILAVNCDSSIQNPLLPTESQSLAKEDQILARLETDPPAGTVFGVDSISYPAVGSECLNAGHWVSNSQGAAFSIELLPGSWVFLSTTASVTISNPVNTYYRTSTSIWTSINYSATVSADSIRIGEYGFCEIETDEELSIGSDPGLGY